MDRNGGLLGTFWIALLAILGVSIGGTYIARNSDDAERVTGLSGSDTRSRAGPRPNDQVVPPEPRGFHRALALLADFVSPFSMYVPDAEGRLVLKGEYADDFCEAVPSACATAVFDRAKPAADRALVELVRKKVAYLEEEEGHCPVEVEFVIATLPDWIDSNSQWSFDPMLSAIHAAASAAGFKLTSFYLPDWDPSARDSAARSSTRERLRHEAEPGAVLFRRWVRSDTQGSDGAVPKCPGHTNLLLLLLVGETATGGVHKEALVSAMDLAVYWDHPKKIRVLGPSYTGSSPSLRASILDVVNQHDLEKEKEPDVLFRIVSTNASGPENQRILSMPGVSSFHSMVNDDNAVLEAMGRYLGTINPDWRCGKGVALLREENTAWSGGIPAKGQSDGGVERTSGSTVDCRKSCAGYKSTPPFPCALTIPFPAHLSRLRSDVSRATSGAKASILSADSRVDLPLTEGRTPIDRLPSFSPGLTAANTETMVDQLLERLRRSGTTAVGILVTDKRDHVFLSSEIARRAPHVLQFAYNGNLLYLRPEVSNYMRGTLVASTYPLYAPTQILTSQESARSMRQFDSPGAQGAFNGLLSLLGQDDLMLDYRSPVVGPLQSSGAGKPAPLAPPSACSDESCPPVWISVVGDDAILPLETYGHSQRDARCDAVEAAPTKKLALPYMLPVQSATEPPDSIDYVTLTRGFAFVLAAVLLVPLWHVSSSVGRSSALVSTKDGSSKDSRHALSTLVGQRLRLLKPISSDVGTGSDASKRDNELSRVREYRTAFFACSAALLVCGVLWIGSVLANFGVEGSSAVATALRQAPAWVVIAGLATLAVYAFWLPDPPSGEVNRPRTVRRSPWLIPLLLVGAYLFLVMLYCSQGGDEPSDWIPDVVLIAITVCAVALVMYRPAAESGDHTAATPIGGYAECRRMVVLTGLASAAALAEFARQPRDDAAALFLVDRAVLLSSYVSPTTFIVLMSAALYWTGIWFERRLDLQLLPDTYVGVSEFITDQARFAAADEAIAGLSPQLGRWWWLSPIAIVTLLFAGAGHAYTVEGRSFNVVVLTASTCVLAMLVHVLVDNVRFGRGLLRTLGAIDKHRIAAQFTSLAAAPINWRPTFQDVRLVDLEPLSDHLTRSDVLLRSQRHAKLLRAASEVDKLLATISADRTRKESAVVSLDLWAQIKQTCKELTTTLDNTKWSTNFKETSWTGEQLKILADLEFIVLFFISLGLRDLVTRLLAGFSTVMGGLVLLTLAHLLYAFQGRPFWLSIDGIAIAVTTGLAMVILVRLEKDTVLSELWGTTPGKFSLFGGVSFRLVTYVVLTLMTLVAAFFPEVGGGIVKWIRFADPMRSALP